MANNSDAKIRANNKYNKNAYFATNIRFLKADENYIRYAVEQSGMSLNSFMIDAIEQKINQMVKDKVILPKKEFMESSELERVAQDTTRRKEEYRNSVTKAYWVKKDETVETESSEQTVVENEKDEQEQSQNRVLSEFLAKKLESSRTEEMRIAREGKAQLFGN